MEPLGKITLSLHTGQRPSTCQPCSRRCHLGTGGSFQASASSGVPSWNKNKDLVGCLTGLAWLDPGAENGVVSFCFPFHFSTMLPSESLCVRFTLRLVRRLQTGPELRKKKRPSLPLHPYTKFCGGVLHSPSWVCAQYFWTTQTQPTFGQVAGSHKHGHTNAQQGVIAERQELWSVPPSLYPEDVWWLYLWPPYCLVIVRVLSSSLGCELL